jgi:mxaK protein
MSMRGPDHSLADAFSFKLRLLRQGTARLWRSYRSMLLVAVTLAGVAGTLSSALQWRNAIVVNNEISALRAGHDTPGTTDAKPELLLARIEFLAQRDEIDGARVLMDALDRGGREDLSATGRYALANALLRRAFDLIERGDLDGAAPFVNLSKREYRRALQLAPSYWDAKFNFDVASRLVRDYPNFEQENGDELQAEPKKLWTDVPGVPKGLP